MPTGELVKHSFPRRVDTTKKNMYEPAPNLHDYCKTSHLDDKCDPERCVINEKGLCVPLKK